MIRDTLPSEKTQRFYDFLGSSYDLFTFFEGRAKSRALQLLELCPGTSVLEVGAGTGKDLELIRQAVQPGGQVAGIDLSTRMVQAAHEGRGLQMCRSDGRTLPFMDAAFDRLYAAYVLDLIPYADLEAMLSGFRRVLRAEGRAVIVSLTEGVNLASKSFISLWKAVYAISPISCGGCRPLELSELAQRAGFTRVEREVIVQLGIPSEILILRQNDARTKPQT